MMYLFIGEKPSNRAYQLGYSWQTKNLCSKQLHDALAKCNIDVSQAVFINLFGDHPDNVEAPKRQAIRKIRAFIENGRTPIAMGKKVSKWLSHYNIVHLKIVHPAALGKIRKKARYESHIKKILLPKKN